MRAAPDAIAIARAVAVAGAAALAGCGSPAHGPDAAPDAGPWQAGLALPGKRLEPGVTALGDRLAMVDGFDANLKILNEADVYDPIAATWSRLPDPPVAWTHVDLAAVDGALYLVGGLATTNYTPDGSVHVLDAAGTAWRSDTPALHLCPMPAGQERGAAAVVVQPPYIYLLGGAQANTSLASVLVFDVAVAPTTCDPSDPMYPWTQRTIPDLPSPRSHAAATLLPDGTLLIAGGLKTLDATQPLDEVWALPIGATAWQPRAHMPTARGGCAYGLFGSKFICAGGEAGASALDVVEAYDWASDTWSTLPPIPRRRAGTQGGHLGTRLYIPGGAQQLNFEPDGTMDVLTVE